LVIGALTAILVAHGIAADELVLHDGSRVQKHDARRRPGQIATHILPAGSALPQSRALGTWTGLRIPLMLGLVASTEMKVAYDSGAAEEADTLDTSYLVKLGYQW
jgi:hypothetical protein